MVRLLGFLFTVILVFPQACKGDDGCTWEVFKGRFVSPDGRVIDRVNENLSHSEGQGLAMLLATRHNDPGTFDIVWRWTRNNIQVRKSDALFAWGWGERSPGEWGPIDLNNATDGDTLIALALFEGAVCWKKDEYRRYALEIIKSIQQHLVVERSGRLFLLPGYYGFVKDNGLILNPSYIISPAYTIFAKYHKPEFWRKLRTDSMDILSKCAFTRLELPADWVYWGPEGPSVYTDKNQVFGFEAIRVLLYLAWDHNIKALSKIGKMLDLVDGLGFIPRNVNLALNTVSLDEAPAGFYAVFARVAAEIGEKDKSRAFWKKALERLTLEKNNYYSYVLCLLSKIDLKP